MQARLAPFDFYTIGYERMSLEELFLCLKGADIRCLIDVRARPWSQVPDYRKAALEDKIAEREGEHGYAIRYVSMPSVGNPYGDDGWKEAYRRMILAKGEELEKLHGILAAHKSALMCYEKDPGDCHRSILAEAIEQRYGMSYADLRR